MSILSRMGKCNLGTLDVSETTDETPENENRPTCFRSSRAVRCSLGDDLEVVVDKDAEPDADPEVALRKSSAWVRACRKRDDSRSQRTWTSSRGHCRGRQ
jgi:hypothetical protein